MLTYSAPFPLSHLQAAEGGKGVFTDAFLSWVENNDAMSIATVFYQIACNAMEKNHITNYL